MWSTLWIGLLIVGLVGALLFTFINRREYNKDRRNNDNSGFRAFVALIVSGVIAVTLAVSLVLSCTYIVDTRQTGIVTKWNRPTGETFGSGLHFILPWTDVHKMDAAIQNDVYNGNNRIQVRLGNNSTALADANLRWRIKEDRADELFQQYKTFDNVRSNLITRNLQTSLNEAFTKFDPLAGDPVAPIGPDGKPNVALAPKKVDMNSVTADALALMKAKSGDEVEIIDLSIPVIDYDDATETKINQINEERANTTKALQQVQTNDAKREAAEKLANMPAPDLKISIANCLNKMADSGVNLNCFPVGQGVLPTINIPNPMG